MRAWPIPPSRVRRAVLACWLLVAGATIVSGADAAGLEPELVAGIDAAVAEVLEATGVPSASVAVVREGAIAFTGAYGAATVEPPSPATADMRYPIGSISKQFTAAALVVLDAEGRLDLDDPLSRYFPDLARADEITLRRLLSHTSGIRDYWPQDYVPPSMLEPIEPAALIARWASQPLDFDPGTQYQYSNTGYVIAGAIVERVAQMPLLQLLRERFFEPLEMRSVLDIDGRSLEPGDPTGYRRFALGPLRPAPKEGKGWLFAAGSLAMTAEDLARWDVAWIEGAGPGAAVFDELGREVRLNSGVGAGYGLGVGLGLEGPRRVVQHGGEVSGFTAINRVYPEARAAVVVLVNQDAVSAARPIAVRIARLLFRETSESDDEMRSRVAAVLADLRKGRIDRTLFTDNANAYFSDGALADIRKSLRGLGKPRSLTQTSRGLRGGLITRVYHAEFGKRRTLEIVTRATEGGLLEQLTVAVGQ